MKSRVKSESRWKVLNLTETSQLVVNQQYVNINLRDPRSPSWRKLIRNNFTDFTCICIVFWTLIWNWKNFMIYVQSLKYLLWCLFMIIWFNMFKHNSLSIVSEVLKCVIHHPSCLISTTGNFTVIEKVCTSGAISKFKSITGHIGFITGSRIWNIWVQTGRPKCFSWTTIHFHLKDVL